MSFPAPTIFETLGVAPLINAAGTVTRLSGGMMAPEVAEAMRQASLACVDMLELQAAACRAIRAATGAEAGMVTSGASAAVLLGAAACLAGLDPAAINLLPEVATGRCEFVVVRSQRNMYDRALRVAGGRIVEIGIADRYSGAGIRDAAAWEVDAAIGDRTAGVYYLAAGQSQPSLAAVAEVTQARGVPLLVDAAAQLPPAANLRWFLDAGADLVAFSGGKAIGGPQASGILCGRGDLVASALLQMLDLDVDVGAWTAPGEFAALGQLRGLPQTGIGRSCKVGKEEVAGLLAALERFVAADPAARADGWRRSLQAIVDAAGPGVALRIEAGTVPLLVLQVGPGAAELARLLLTGTPRIACGLGRQEAGALLFNPMALTVETGAAIGGRLRALLGG